MSNTQALGFYIIWLGGVRQFGGLKPGAKDAVIDKLRDLDCGVYHYWWGLYIPQLGLGVNKSLFKKCYQH